MAQKEIVYQGHKFTLSYEVYHHEQTREVLFLHGWGSNKELMKHAFGAYFAGFRHIYLDLPGFGKSPNSETLRTQDYAGIVRAFLDALGSKGDFIIAHSFGGKIATLLAPQKLALLSSAGIVPKKSLSTRLKIALAKLARFLGIGAVARFLRSKDVTNMPQNMYETFKNVVDEDFTECFMNFNGSATIFWGEEDRATPLSSGQKIASLIPKSSLFILKGDHFFFLKQGAEIERIIVKGIALNLYCFKIIGKVQGVGYRKFAQKCAQELAIKGTVRNLPDGSVELFALLSEANKEAFLARLREGSELACVQNIEESRYDSHDSLLQNFKSFEILY
ncbi:MAG: alpha/beta fold hydrolase [Wolinella sp.]